MQFWANREIDEEEASVTIYQQVVVVGGNGRLRVN